MVEFLLLVHIQIIIKIGGLSYSQFIKIDDNYCKYTNTEFMKNVENYAKLNFKEIEITEFVNEISIPSIDIFRQYWQSNVYYDSEYDSEFEYYAKKHFDEFNNFQYSKKAANNYYEKTFFLIFTNVIHFIF